MIRYGSGVPSEDSLLTSLMASSAAIQQSYGKWERGGQDARAFS